MDSTQGQSVRNKSGLFFLPVVLLASLLFVACGTGAVTVPPSSDTSPVNATIEVDAGQRSSSRVYFNGGTIPGEKDRVYMEWTAEVIDSPYREGNVIPQSVRDAGSGTRDLIESSYIEFYELMTPAKFQE